MIPTYEIFLFYSKLCLGLSHNNLSYSGSYMIHNKRNYNGNIFAADRDMYCNDKVMKDGSPHWQKAGPWFVDLCWFIRTGDDLMM